MKTEKQNRQGIRKAQRIDNPPHRLLTLKQAAEYLGPGVTVWTLRERIWAGDIPFMQWPGGRKILVDMKDLNAFVERNKRTFN